MKQAGYRVDVPALFSMSLALAQSPHMNLPARLPDHRGMAALEVGGWMLLLLVLERLMLSFAGKSRG